MKLKFFFLALLFIPLATQAQTTPSYCTTTTPCADLVWTNGTDITPTVTTNSSGVETAGPAVAKFMRCTVAGTETCTVTNGVLANPSSWSVVPITNGQSLNVSSNTGGPFYDPSIAYNTTYSYTLNLTWTGSLGGVASLYAVPFQMATESAPTTAPTTPTGIVVTETP